MANEVQKQIDQTESRYPLRILGHTTEGDEVYISEEGRSVNTHIIGSSQQGKSKFLIYNIAEDIKLGNGLCLLDPTSNGSTAREVLQYCASIGYEKVCLIDHTTLYRFKKIACIRPLWGRKDEDTGIIYPDDAAINGVMEAVKILLKVKSASEINRMEPRLQALFATLIRKGGTMYESRYFFKYNDPRRFDFLGDDEDSDFVESNFRTQNTFENYFSSSVNTLQHFKKDPLSLMLAADIGIDFRKMIRDKWVILVNLCPGGSFTPEQSQLLGVLIISQILQAADWLTTHGWKGREYIYIDEAGRFATSQMEQILSYQRHIGVSLILAHHYMKQFEFPSVLDAVLQNTGIKMMFNVREPDDRLRMMKSFNYGGDIKPEDAAWANADLKKQYVILKNDKGKPGKVRTPDVHVPDVDTTEYTEWVLRDPWYLTRDQIKSQINARLTSKSSSRPKNTGHRKASNTKPANPDNVPRGIPKPAGAVSDSGVSTGIKKPSKPSGDEGIKF